MDAERNEDADDHEAEVSLEDLTTAFAEVFAQQNAKDGQVSGEDATNDASTDERRCEESTLDKDGDVIPQELLIPQEEAETVEDELAISPLVILEGALFIGNSESRYTSAGELAKLMRDVSPSEIEDFVEELNESYSTASQALRIDQSEGGYRMTISASNEIVRSAFAGKMREARLPQLAIEVLALVAYQPGISAGEVQDQRGRDCNAILNQLVRRRLLTLTREKPENGGRAISKYATTDRFLELFGLESLEELPQVHEDLE
ncbi:MAG: SMC-Scp complex subunit ScpB [Planctomycetota bacterium]